MPPHSKVLRTKWAYPGFVDRLLFESGESRLTSFEVER
jgi:hypothetical protein